MEAVKNELVTTCVEVITPSKAAEYLKHNRSNRAIRQLQVKKYAHEMQNGTWELNGEPIVFSATGTLLNGQHRLSAVIESCCAVPFVVIRGISDSVSTFDMNIPRNVADTLVLGGIPKYLANNTNVAVAKLHYYYQAGAKVTPNSTVKDFLIRHKDSFAVMDDVFKLAKNKTGGRLNVKVAPFILTAIYAYESGFDKNVLAEFFSTVRTGYYDGDEKTAAITFRNDLMAGYVPVHGGSRTQSIPMLEKALYDFSRKTPRVKSYRFTTTPIFSKSSAFSGDI